MPSWSKSHPAWVCGLKLFSINHWCTSLGHTLRGCVDWNYAVGEYGPVHLSHPAWVCGLKHIMWIIGPVPVSHTLRGCVDWNKLIWHRFYWIRVTPCVGVWIETVKEKTTGRDAMSHPAWVCGLKQFLPYDNNRSVCHTLRGCVDWNWPDGRSVWH